jgi:steroid delta-isomerase-like uncharacterized protein
MNATDLVHEFAAAFTRHDVPAILACFTDDAVYHDTFYGRHTGQAGIEELFEQTFRDGTEYTWTMHIVVADAVRAAAEWSFSYTVTEAIPRSAGRKVRFSGMSLFELKAGKIAGYREYVDTGVVLLQLGFAPESLAKVLSRRLPA